MSDFDFDGVFGNVGGSAPTPGESKPDNEAAEKAVKALVMPGGYREVKEEKLRAMGIEPKSPADALQTVASFAALHLVEKSDEGKTWADAFGSMTQQQVTQLIYELGAAKAALNAVGLAIALTQIKKKLGKQA